MGTTRLELGDWGKVEVGQGGYSKMIKMRVRVEGSLRVMQKQEVNENFLPEE